MNPPCHLQVAIEAGREKEGDETRGAVAVTLVIDVRQDHQPEDLQSEGASCSMHG